MYNPCDAVTLPSGEKPEVVVFTNDQQRALVQASYRHRYGVFIRLDFHRMETATEPPMMEGR